MDNLARALTAATALAAFKRATRTDDEDLLPDLLCNLLHYAGQSGIDFDAMLERARSNYEAELEEEGDAD